ncbi:MAG: hypothetical protein ABR886_06770 [Dehalococcoidales bacterium]|jgi:hypothetical protein
MPTIDKLKNIKHGAFISEFQPGSSVHKEITAPMIGAFAGKDIAGANMALGLAYLTRPFVMIDASHKHDFDQFLFFISGDPNNFVEFDAEVELTLDGKVNSITYASWVYIPKGLMHCPLNVKRVGKPIIFMDGRLTKEASVGPGFKGSK